MANRYWVGGGGIWDNSDTTHWSTTSGGAGGASVPTSADNVIFDANSKGPATSSYTVGFGAYSYDATKTMTCLDLTFTGITGITLSFVGAYNKLNLYGSFTVDSTSAPNIQATTWMYIYLYGSGKTLAPNNATESTKNCFLATGYYFQTGSSYTLGSNIANCLELNVGAGTLNTSTYALVTNATNGGYNVNLSLTSGTVNFGSSAHYIYNFSIYGAATITGSGYSIYTYNFTCNASTNVTIANLYIGYTAYQPANTYATYILSNSGTGLLTITDLTVNAKPAGSSVKMASLSFEQTSAITITNFNIVNTSSANRIVIYSPKGATNGTTTITSSGTRSVSYADFLGITFAGTALSGTDLGDLGYNSNITFGAVNSRYWVGGAGNWTDTTHWSTTSGGAGGSSIPSGNSNVIFDANSGSGICSINTAIVCRSVSVNSAYPGDWGNSSHSYGLVGHIIAGSFEIFKTGLNLSSALNSLQYFLIIPYGASTANITTSDGTITSYYTLLHPDKLYNMTGPFRINTEIYIFYNYWFNYYQGSGTSTLTTNNYEIESKSFNWGNGGTKTINFGTSNVIFKSTSGTSYINLPSSGITLNGISSGTATVCVKLGGADAYIYSYSGYLTPGKLRVMSSTSGYLRWSTDQATSSYPNITLDPGAKVMFPSGKTISATSWNVAGVSGNPVTLRSETSGTQYTLSSGSAKTFDYVDIKDCIASPATWTATNSINSGNNTGWTITAPVVKANGLFFGSNF